MGQCPDRPSDRATDRGRRAGGFDDGAAAAVRLRMAAGKGSWRMDGWRVGRSSGWGHFFEIRSLEAPEKT